MKVVFLVEWVRKYLKYLSSGTGWCVWYIFRIGLANGTSYDIEQLEVQLVIGIIAQVY